VTAGIHCLNAELEHKAPHCNSWCWHARGLIRLWEGRVSSYQRSPWWWGGFEWWASKWPFLFSATPWLGISFHF
jgi:hypothetical protein